jgi:hypothetical protein
LGFAKPIRRPYSDLVFGFQRWNHASVRTFMRYHLRTLLMLLAWGGLIAAEFQWVGWCAEAFQQILARLGLAASP